MRDVQRLMAAAGCASIVELTGPLGPHEISFEDEIGIQAEDGVRLIGSLVRPNAPEATPAILIRTPYKREGHLPQAAFWASHGYATFVQDTRSPTSYFWDARDGRDTVRWIEDQPWFDGRLGLTGHSYMAFAAWATASTRPESLRAMALAEYSTDRVSAWYPGGTLNLDLALTWSGDNESSQPAATGAEDPFMHLPLSEADVILSGHTLQFYQERLSYGPDDPHWRPLDFTAIAEDPRVPVLLIDGWYDYQRTPLFEDFERIGRSGVPRRLVFGPWTHSTLDQRRMLAESLAWFDHHILGRPSSAIEATIFETGGPGWIDLPSWPRSPKTLTLYAGSEGTLGTERSLTASEESWAYDPGSPTPAVGLTAFGGLDIGGPQDNRELELRDDVRLFTTDLLEDDIECIGRVTAHFSAFCDTPTADFVVRVLDAHPDGRSLNVCEGIRRINSDNLIRDGVPVVLDLGPIGHRFAKGHAIRMLVASGAHPYFARNLGANEPWDLARSLHETRPAITIGGATGLSLTMTLAKGL